MKRRCLQLLCLMLAMALVLCGCGKEEAAPEPTETEPVVLSAEEVAAKMQEAVKQTPCSEAQVTMDMTLSIEAEGVDPMEITTKTSTKTTLCMDPLSSHSVVTVAMNEADAGMQTQTESYTVTEDGTLVTYTCADGVWVKTATEQTPEEFAKAIAGVHVDPGHVSIDETVTQWNGKDAICLKSEMSGESLQSAVDGVLSNMEATLGDSAALLENADYTKLSCSAVIYLDPVTYLPMAEELTFTGLGDVVASLFADMGVTVDVPVYTANAEFLSYDVRPAITLPEGVAQKAEAWTRLLANEPDNGDGTFTIREGMALVDLAHPEGFEVKEKDYDHVTFRRDDYRTIIYTVYYLTGTDTTGASFLATNDKSEKRWTELGGGKVEREQLELATDSYGFTCDLLSTTWETGRTDANFYAWTTLGTDDAGTYYLHVEVTDGYNDGMGFSKNADITPDEFVAYLNAAMPSKLTAE